MLKQLQNNVKLFMISNNVQTIEHNILNNLRMFCRFFSCVPSTVCFTTIRFICFLRLVCGMRHRPLHSQALPDVVPAYIRHPKTTSHVSHICSPMQRLGPVHVHEKKQPNAHVVLSADIDIHV